MEGVMFHGSIVALVTPFKNGVVDESALAGLVEFHLRAGTHGIVPCGTTGESATLTDVEHRRVIEVVVEAAARRVPVIAGSGSNNTEEAIALTRHAKKAGADGALLISPYYNKPTQEGLYQHYRAIARSVDLPLLLYNIPSRTGVNILPETVARLTAFRNIVGIKEGTGSLQQASDIMQACGDRITLLSGDDFTALPLMSIGGKGVISVTANIVPAEMAAMIAAAEKGDYAEAARLHYRIYPLHTAMFLETNPAPVKAALALMGKCSNAVRLPLCGLSDENAAKLQSTLTAFGLLPASRRRK